MLGLGYLAYLQYQPAANAAAPEAVAKQPLTFSERALEKPSLRRQSVPQSAPAPVAARQ